MSTGNYAMVNKHPIYYEQFGIGRPVVLLHGGLHTIHLSFEKQIPVFAEQHHVIAIEQVGHGHSADIEGPFSYAQMAEDTAELLRQLNITNADFVGWRDGGILSLLLARRHPTLVRRLVISGANIRAEGVSAKFLTYFRETPPDQIATDLSDLREVYEQTSPDGLDHWPIVVAKTVNMMITLVILEKIGSCCNPSAGACSCWGPRRNHLRPYAGDVRITPTGTIVYSSWNRS